MWQCSREKKLTLKCGSIFIFTFGGLREKRAGEMWDLGSMSAFVLGMRKSMKISVGDDNLVFQCSP